MGSRLVIRAGIEGLDQFHCSLSRPHIAPSRNGQEGGVRNSQHIAAVRLRLYLQAPPEIGVGVHLIRHYAGGFLRHNHRVDAKRTSAPEHMVKGARKIRKLGLELCKLIDHQNQERHLLHIPGFPAFRQIFADIIDPRLVKYPLAALHLALQGKQAAPDVRIQIGNAPGQMGQLLKRLQKAGALKIHQDEVHILRRKLKGHGSNPALSHLRFAAAGGSRRQAVGTVLRLMDIKVIILPVFSHADWHGQRLLTAGILPEVPDIQLIDF